VNFVREIHPVCFRREARLRWVNFTQNDAESGRR
jgi:hypothetical protein